MADSLEPDALASIEIIAAEIPQAGKQVRMNSYSLRFDRSGNLETGLFFQLIDVLIGVTKIPSEVENNKKKALQRMVHTDRDWPFFTVETGKERLFSGYTLCGIGEDAPPIGCQNSRCSTTYGGVTGSYSTSDQAMAGFFANHMNGVDRVHTSDEVIGSVLGPGLQLHEHDYRRLLKAGLSGVNGSPVFIKGEVFDFEVDPFKVLRDEVLDFDPCYYLVEPNNANVFQKRLVFPSNEYLCPFCSHRPEYCDTCGELLSDKCSKCGKKLAESRRDLMDVRERDPDLLLIEDDPAVINGEQWRGQDILGFKEHLYVSRRVVRHFQDNSVGPCLFSSVYFCTDGMGVIQTRLLEEIAATELKQG